MQPGILGFLKPRNNDHPSSSGHEEDGTSTSVSAHDDIHDPVAEVTESLTPSCSSDNYSVASAEDDGPPTTVCGREEPLEGCQLTDLQKTYSDDPADWKITRELIEFYTITELGQGSSQIGEIVHVQMKLFIGKLANEESVTRDWFVYSPSTGNVYCYVCKLFRSGSDSFFF